MSTLRGKRELRTCKEYFESQREETEGARRDCDGNLEQEVRTMRSILIRSRVGADGVLHLDVPSDLVETDVEVMVILQPVSQPDLGRTGEPGWPPGFFENVVGGWQGERLKRECEGEYETREYL
jgi:hypothetical protein